MENRLMHRTMHKNARFEVESRIERSRRLTVHSQKEKRDREHFLRRKVDVVIVEPTPPRPAAQETRRDKLLKWKAEKEALLLALKATKKPPFKLGAFQGTTIKDVTNIPPPPKSAVKSTVKKTPAERLVQAKNPTAASKALAALSDNKRITRSQTKAIIKPLAMPKPVAKTQSRPAAVPKTNPQSSFAPANHKFKAPINLTFPVTPDVMKRNKSLRSTSASKKMAGWPLFPGVEPLMVNNSFLNFNSSTNGLVAKSGEPVKVNPRKRVISSEDSSSKTVPKSAGEAVTVSPRKRLISSEDSSKTVAESAGEPDIVSPKRSLISSEVPKPADEPVKASPKKRRSVRLAAPQAGGSSQESPRNNVEIEENAAMARKISRLSIHSPTPKEVVTTPPPNTVPAQFSPFIVTGRGTDRHNRRQSRGNGVVQANTKELLRAEQVKHFRSLLDTETKRLLDLCDLWDQVKETATGEIPADAQDLILGAVGQARLLTKDKFQQFKRLVDKFEEGESQDEKMTADDLTGFWEMVQLTVKGVDDRFKKLSDLKGNNWKEEEKTRLKAAATKNPKVVTALRVRKLDPTVLEQSRARIREAIAAAKKRQQERRDQSRKENEKSFDGGFFKVESPQRKTEKDAHQKEASTPNPRKSLIRQVLTNSANRAVKSPSVTDVATRMRVSLMGRRISVSRPEEQNFISPVPSTNAVPSKSILKSGKSAKRHTVAFQKAESKENSEPEDATASFKPRRSLRFSAGTKFDDSLQ